MDFKGSKRQACSKSELPPKAGVNQGSPETTTVISDAKSPPYSSGETPTGPRSKHRVKLWDSILRKTRKIRVRTKNTSSKLEKRASSQPNISSDSSLTSNPGSQSKDMVTFPNGTDSVGESHIQSAEYRRNQYSHQRVISRSSTSLNDSVGGLESLSSAKVNSRVSFRYSEVIQDSGYYHSTFQRSTWTKRDIQRESEEDLSVDRNSNIETADDIKNNDPGEDSEDKDSVPVTEDSSHQVNKTVGSPGSAASTVNLLPGTTLNSVSRQGRHSLQPSSLEPNTDSMVIYSHRARRHSYCDTTRDGIEDYLNFYDCTDSLSMTSSNKEPSPVPCLDNVERDSSESREKEEERFVKGQSTLSSGVSDCLSRISNSASPDNEEDDGSKVAEFDTSLLVPSKRDSPNISERSSIIVPTCRIQEPSVIPALDQHMSQQSSLFQLNVHLREGKDLVIRDSCGTSDPYVKFKIGNKVLYKSRIIYKNLNPCWDETFTIPVDDITKPIVLKVFDYDRAWNDDPMGGTEIDLLSLEINKETELKLPLSEKGKEEYMGYLLLTCTLVPKVEEVNKDQDRANRKSSFFRRSTRSTDSARKMKMQLWNGVVNIVLVEGCNLVSMDDNGFSDPYVKFKLGLEKYRSKFKNKTLNPRWLEQFDLHLYDDQTWQLEIMVYDHDTRGRDDFMGRAVIDLSQLEKEKTHIIEQQLEDGAGTIRLLLTVSGTVGHEISSDLANYTPDAQFRDKVISRYGLFNSFRALDDVGYLEVKVFRAHDLQAADFGGLSDPFCVLELVNDRVQTHTEYKTLNPDWSKVFTFQVKDIHSVLEVTVYDEDRNKKVEFLGKVAIPLLKIKNNERRWYALKDRKMTHKTKGAILLEMFLVFNHLKAGIRTVNPREEKLMLPDQKFKIATMKQNINRVSHLIGVFMDTGRFIQSCFDWQSPPRSITAFIVYLLIVWNFELYMLPISLLLIFMKNLLVAHVVGNAKKEPVEDIVEMDEEEDDDDEKDKQEEKKSIVDRYHAVQEVCLTVQQALDTVASLGERVKNTFNWSVPWLSSLAVVALLAGSIVLFYIPPRILLLAWGINKFTKKLRKPNAISNNELLDFLSRVPSDNELLQYKELRPDIPANTVSTKKKRS